MFLAASRRHSINANQTRNQRRLSIWSAPPFTTQSWTPNWSSVPAFVGYGSFTGRSTKNWYRSSQGRFYQYRLRFACPAIIFDGPGYSSKNYHANWSNLIHTWPLLDLGQVKISVHTVSSFPLPIPLSQRKILGDYKNYWLRVWTIVTPWFRLLIKGFDHPRCCVVLFRSSSLSVDLLLLKIHHEAKRQGRRYGLPEGAMRPHWCIYI